MENRDIPLRKYIIEWSQTVTFFVVQLEYIETTVRFA